MKDASRSAGTGPSIRANSLGWAVRNERSAADSRARRRIPPPSSTRHMFLRRRLMSIRLAYCNGRATVYSLEFPVNLRRPPCVGAKNLRDLLDCRIDCARCWQGLPRFMLMYR